MSKRVFILGAGASYACDSRLPLMQGFFDESVTADAPGDYHVVDWGTRPPHFDMLRRFLYWQFQGFDKIDNEGKPGIDINELKLVNVEEVFIHLAQTINETSKDDPLFGELLIVRNQLLSYVSRRLLYGQNPNLSLYEQLLKVLNPDTDSIVSFNWDVLLDLALWDVDRFQVWEINRSALLQGASRLKTHYLKMHGSLNWYYCDNNCPNKDVVLRESPFGPGMPHFNNHGVDPFLYSEGWPRCPKCQAPLRRAIIPPSGAKFERMPTPIRGQWPIARTLLREAKEWVLIGYSIPDLDVEAKSLFRSATRSLLLKLSDEGAHIYKCIHIANPKAEEISEQKIQPLGPASTLEIHIYKNFQDFLES